MAVRLSIGRLFVDEERAVTVSDEHGAIGVEIRPDTGVILGGRWRLRSRGRSAGKIGGIIHGIEIGWDCGVRTRDLWIVSRRSDQLNQGGLETEAVCWYGDTSAWGLISGTESGT